MDTNTLRNFYGRAGIDDRQVNELIGVAHGLIADDHVSQIEAEYLYKWLAANKDATGNPVVGLLFERIKEYLKDGVLDAEESAELLDTLKRFSGGDFELGEAQKSSSLPLCTPAPAVVFPQSRFCFTGTFEFGNRSACEEAVERLGAIAGSLTQKTNYLVIGVYCTDSWAHSSFGRKIEKAVKYREKQGSIAIIDEEHWVQALNSAI